MGPTAKAMSEALALCPSGTVLKVLYRGENAPAPAEYVGTLAGFSEGSFTLHTDEGVRRFLAQEGRLFGIELVRRGTGKAG